MQQDIRDSGRGEQVQRRPWHAPVFYSEPVSDTKSFHVSSGSDIHPVSSNLTHS
jgi:hypothetical protein